MPRWDDLRFLAALLKTGTLTAAAREEGVDPATVSRRIGRLSETLGIELLVKSPGGWEVNPAARPLAEEALTFESRSHQAINALRARDGALQGDITLAAPPAVFSHILNPALPDFARRYPAVDVALRQRIMSDSLGDNDLMVTPVRPERGRLVVRRLGHLVFHIYAHRAETPPDRWIGLVREHDDLGAGAWSLAQMPRPPAYRLESFPEVLGLMRALRLPGVLPAMVAADDPTLRPLFPGRAPMHMNLYLCFHETRRHDPLVRAAADWVSAAYEAAANGATPTQP